MAHAQTALTVLHIVSIVFFALGLLFIVIAIGMEEWSVDSGSTQSNPVGHVSVRHEVGIFRTQVSECCLTDGQLVPDFGVVCNLRGKHRGCANFYVTSAEYCSFVAMKNERAERGTMDCSEFEAGTIMSAVLVIAAVVACVAVIIALAFQVAHAGVLLIASLTMVIGSIVVLIFMNILVHDNQVEWVRTRYQDSSILVDPSFSYQLGTSYKMMAAALGMWAVSAIIAGAVWWARRRPQAKLAPLPAPRPMPPQHIMTPAATGGAHPMAGMSQRHEQVLPQCPADLECQLIDDFGHQLQYAHTCRLPFCTDTSAAHHRHFMHQ
jgi:hypothetical protein